MSTTYAREIVTGILVFLGGCQLVDMVAAWLEDRLARTGWRLHRRWDHPGAEVLLPDGRTACIETVYRGERAGDIAVVIFEDAAPEWMLVAALSPMPAAAAVTA